MYCENDERDGDCYRKSLIMLENKYAEVTQLVERQPSKLKVAGSNPVFRSKTIFEDILYTIWEWDITIIIKKQLSKPNIYRILITQGVEYLRCI